MKKKFVVFLLAGFSKGHNIMNNQMCNVKSMPFQLIKTIPDQTS